MSLYGTSLTMIWLWMQSSSWKDRCPKILLCLKSKQNKIYSNTDTQFILVLGAKHLIEEPWKIVWICEKVRQQLPLLSIFNWTIFPQVVSEEARSFEKWTVEKWGLNLCQTSVQSPNQQNHSTEGFNALNSSKMQMTTTLYLPGGATCLTYSTQPSVTRRLPVL